jgi:hypothetical protein
MSNWTNGWQDDPAKVAVVKRMQEDLRWAMEHHDELDRQYHGECVVIWQKQIIAYGTDEGALLNQAAHAGYPRAELIIVDFPNTLDGPLEWGDYSYGF